MRNLRQYQYHLARVSYFNILRKHIPSFRFEHIDSTNLVRNKLLMTN